MKRQIIKTDKRVIVEVVNDFTNESETIIFKERFAILPYTRWSLAVKYINRYFIDNGQRGCYIGRKRGKDGLIYDIWDLSKIFPKIQFIENNYNDYKDI